MKLRKRKKRKDSAVGTVMSNAEDAAAFVQAHNLWLDTAAEGCFLRCGKSVVHGVFAAHDS
ncbi:MAG: hypothetical protein ACOYD9_07195 [Pyramidobacter sp.]